MSAVKLMADIKRNRGGGTGTEGAFEYEWGSAKMLEGVDLETLSRAELRNHLEARDIDAKGSKPQLVDALDRSLEEERLASIAYTEALEAEFQINKDLEERGSVYAVGTNHAGQLGQGDLESRNIFTCVPATRGMGVMGCFAGNDSAFAITEDHEVLVWGGSGVGPTGIDEAPEDEMTAPLFMEPQIISSLNGEEIDAVSIGAGHACATSMGGDCFVWGYNRCGQLGLGHYHEKPSPQIVTGFPEGTGIKQVVAGENHSVALTDGGKVYVWGHVADGRLGVGAKERIGAPPEERLFFPAPALLGSLAQETVRQVSCGVAHTMCLTETGVFSWGGGSGGRLGHGDTKDRFQPTRIDTFNREIVCQISVGTWHSAAIVLIPPLRDAGWVFTWGSGYHGQLGQGSLVMQLEPKLVEAMLETQLTARSISCGSHHNAAITNDGELYTWGSNVNNCLGREIEELDITYSAHPGHAGGFGAIVDRVGRGMTRSVSCGKEFTLVATYPYDGPTEDVARKLMEEEELRQEEAQMRLDEAERERKRAEKQREKEKRYQVEAEDSDDSDDEDDGNDEQKVQASSILDKKMSRGR